MKFMWIKLSSWNHYWSRELKKHYPMKTLEKLSKMQNKMKKSLKQFRQIKEAK